MYTPSFFTSTRAETAWRSKEVYKWLFEKLNKNSPRFISQTRWAIHNINSSKYIVFKIQIRKITTWIHHSSAPPCTSVLNFYYLNQDGKGLTFSMGTPVPFSPALSQLKSELQTLLKISPPIGLTEIGHRGYISMPQAAVLDLPKL